MKFNLLLLISLFSMFGWCQKKEVILKIDTLDFIDKYDDYWGFKILVTNQGFANMGDSFDSSEFEFNDFPQYYIRIILQTDSSQVKIPLDNLGGYFEIQGLYNSEIDTLHIEKYSLYSNCNYDTAHVWKTYFENDTLLVDKGKSYFETIIKQLTCKRKAPAFLRLKINGIKYQIPIAFGSSQSGLVRTGNGSRRTTFGKEKNRFRFKEIHSYGINSATLRLKNTPQ